VTKGRVPTGGTPYVVESGESLASIAKDHGLDAWDLIDFNFETKRTPECVNWYLHNYLRCTKVTADGYNYSFSGGEVIHLPPAKPKPTPTPKPPADPLTTIYEIGDEKGDR
jgi:hypothetical protein